MWSRKLYSSRRATITCNLKWYLLQTKIKSSDLFVRYERSLVTAFLGEVLRQSRQLNYKFSVVQFSDHSATEPHHIRFVWFNLWWNIFLTFNLTFIGPCIVNIFAEYNQQDAWLAAGSSIGLTNTWHCMCSFELLMMDRKTVWNM